MLRAGPVEGGGLAPASLGPLARSCWRWLASSGWGWPDHRPRPAGRLVSPVASTGAGVGPLVGPVGW